MLVLSLQRGLSLKALLFERLFTMGLIVWE